MLSCFEITITASPHKIAKHTQNIEIMSFTPLSLERWKQFANRSLPAGNLTAY